MLELLNPDNLINVSCVQKVVILLGASFLVLNPTSISSIGAHFYVNYGDFFHFVNCSFSLLHVAGLYGLHHAWSKVALSR